MRAYTVLVDTREQKPYEWQEALCVRQTLAVGDYSILGHDTLVGVERKSFEDFYGCLTRGRRRFEACLQRLSAIRYPLVVIEADMHALLQPFTYAAGGYTHRSLLPPLVAQNSLLSWQAKYRVPFLLCGDRERAARMTLQHLDVAWRTLEDERRAQRRSERKQRAIARLSDERIPGGFESA